MTYAPGSLVKVRGREWTVLPCDDAGWIRLRPLVGTALETVLVSPDLEEVRPAAFALPDPDKAGDAASGALLRDAVRLGLRSTCGPFRSFGRIAVEPRPYQLVPLLLALRQPVIRLLIADDVGIGKTVEAGLIAREMLDRGEISRLTVLCPPQLAEQWQAELEDKFHIDAELVLPSTVGRLERGLGIGTSIFDVYPFTVVSLDFIKSQRHRNEFLRVCPEFVIVDEAHACASPTGMRATRQRYELVRKLASDKDRHMLFVTATPHSGKDDVFKSLLGFLDPKFLDYPEDLAGRAHEAERRALAGCFVQRRRGDIRAYMDTATPFPERLSGEVTWRFSGREADYFRNVLALARDSMRMGEGKDEFRRRLFFWSALALLRSVGSSPAAAKATLLARSPGSGDGTMDPDRLDDEARGHVCDLDCDDAAATDTLAGADGSDALDGDDAARKALRARYRRLADEADALRGMEHDSKLRGLAEQLRKLVKEGYAPVVFCRYITTAEYLCEELRNALHGVTFAAVTGTLPPAEREARVGELAGHDKRVLICTDCLSEGINLQRAFNAVVHYDLSWNPTRHEQREGRVDRFGQPFPQVKVITYYGEDDPIDGYVLDVLLRKHEAIRKALGVSVSCPEDTEKVMKSIITGYLLKEGTRRNEVRGPLLPGLEAFLAQDRKRLDAEWDGLAAREQKRSRTVFAQQGIHVDEVARELASATEASGDAAAVEAFVAEAVQRLGGLDRTSPVPGTKARRHAFTLDAAVRGRHRGLDFPDRLDAVFGLPGTRDVLSLRRTHPLVERLAAYVFENAMDDTDPDAPPVACRCGVMRTDSVGEKTVLLLCRCRYGLTTTTATATRTDLTEECVLLAFTGMPRSAVWLPDERTGTLLSAVPSSNVLPSIARGNIARLNADVPLLVPHLKDVMKARAALFLEAHRRVRTAARMKGLRYEVAPQGEPDVIGLYVYLPEQRGLS